MLKYNHGYADPAGTRAAHQRRLPGAVAGGTRWADNDMFGHLNNAVYYQLFDTAINAWITIGTGLDPTTMPALGIVAESGCRYFSELHFPQNLVVGLAVTRLGRSSVTYRLGVFESKEGRSHCRSPRSDTGCTSTSTGPAANPSQFPTPSGPCCRRPASRNRPRVWPR